MLSVKYALQKYENFTTYATPKSSIYFVSMNEIISLPDMQTLR